MSCQAGFGSSKSDGLEPRCIKGSEDSLAIIQLYGCWFPSYVWLLYLFWKQNSCYIVRSKKLRHAITSHLRIQMTLSQIGLMLTANVVVLMASDAKITLVTLNSCWWLWLWPQCTVLQLTSHAGCVLSLVKILHLNCIVPQPCLQQGLTALSSSYTWNVHNQISHFQIVEFNPNQPTVRHCSQFQ